MAPLKHPVGAVIVTFYPDVQFKARLSAISKQVSHVFVVDNTANEDIAHQLKNWADEIKGTLILNVSNLGIATALNIGTKAAENAGFKWVITFDQDSTPSIDMTEKLLETLAKGANSETVAIVGSNIAHRYIPNSSYSWLTQQKGLPFLFERATVINSDLENVTMVITSGSLINLSILEKLGGFRDEFFIDYVDTEYCLRAKKAGFKILVSAKAILNHQLGEKREKKLFGIIFKPTFHSALRLYYISRNRISMFREYALIFPHWLLFDLTAAFYNAFRIFLLEDKRFDKFVAILQGTWDGLRGKMGPKNP
jgi:rhamnosyltransferase